MIHDDFIKWFAKKAEESGKLFIPDSPRQEKVAKSLITFHNKHFSMDILKASASAYINDSSESVLIFDFALSVKEYRDKAVVDQESKDEFKEILRQTRERKLQRESRNNITQ